MGRVVLSRAMERGPKHCRGGGNLQRVVTPATAPLSAAQPKNIYCFTLSHEVSFLRSCVPAALGSRGGGKEPSCTTTKVLQICTATP